MRNKHMRSREEQYWRKRNVWRYCRTAVVVMLCGLAAFVGTWTYGKSGRFFPTRETIWDTASIHFVDVGQGDACVLLDAGHAVLVDTGVEGMASRLCSYLESCVGRIDLFFLTHDHADHCGGAEEILSRFTVETLVIPDAGDWETIVDVAMENQVRVIRYTPEDAGMQLYAGAITCTILGPTSFSESNANNNSLLVRADLAVDGNSCTVLLTGDAETEEEDDVLNGSLYTSLSADILKIGHHGSSSSTSLAFFYAVNPRVCVISCGKDNTYGHPHSETIALLQEAAVPYCRTDIEGNVVLDFDGEKLTKR